ncbi:MAG TPA: hypothetical protein VMJ31_05410 [Methylocystis sp.]|nr:hypothetical protein [Methylocystis sp.]
MRELAGPFEAAVFPAPRQGIKVKPKGGDAEIVIDPENLGERLSRKMALSLREPRAGAILGALLSLGACACAAQTSPPQDDPPAEARLLPYSGELPACAHELVLAEIARKFWDRERDYWDSALSLESFLVIRETGLRTRGLSLIPRRHCEASARFNDGQIRPVIYTIGEDLGFIGFAWGVDWCVVGLDRGRAYNPACSGAGP